MTKPIVGGRPLAYETVEELQAKIEEYFTYCDEKKEISVNDKGHEKVIQKPYTMSGLCVYLKISKDTLWEYARKSEYAEIVKWAKSMVENYCEENTMAGKLNPIFSIFSLKNNFGWTDRIEVNTTTQPEQLSVNDIKKALNGKSSKE